MKKLLFVFAAMALSAGLFAQKKVADVAKFETETIDQGKLKQGSPQPAKFIITNTSNENIIIEQANPTCGCTISDYTKEPIPPGKTGYINATYNAANPGHYDKHLTVKLAGIDEIKSIVITGDVLADADYTKWKADNDASIAKTKEEEAAKLKAAEPVKSTSKGKTKKSKTKKVVTSTVKS